MTQPAQPVRFVLELDPHSEPVRGSVTDGAGNTRDYVGWVALIGALYDWPWLEPRGPEGEEKVL